jgi:hypothetical protein
VRYELRAPADVDPFDDMVAVAPNGVVVAVPDLPDAIGNLVAAGFVIESCEVLDDTA